VEISLAAEDRAVTLNWMFPAVGTGEYGAAKALAAGISTMDDRYTQGQIHARDDSLVKGQCCVPSLEFMATVALDAGRMLMEAGASAGSVQGIVDMVAHGLGADRVDLRIGYASLAITIGIQQVSVTRLRRVGELGVNQRVIQSLWDIGNRVVSHELTAEQTHVELMRLATQIPLHSPWIVAIAVGIACAAFGRLLGVDWHATGPVLLAAMAGQFLRGKLLRAHVNVFICTWLISFLCSVMGGLGARLVGSNTMTAAMIASILLLVPGVPAVNAQSDILEGHPTLGSARAVTVVMTLVFIAAGLWIGKISLDHWA
jgi:uncharacterized membrane protein YjjP (DUF1212 family)